VESSDSRSVPVEFSLTHSISNKGSIKFGLVLE